MATHSSAAETDIPPILSDDDEENIVLPKKIRKKLLIDSSDDEIMSLEEGGEKDLEEDLESKSEDESLAEDEESSEGDSEGAEDDDDDDADSEDDEDSDKSDASSLLSFDSEFSWDEFQYIDDNAENSFIQDEEENLRERYNTVMKMLLSEQAEEGFDSLSMLYEEPLIQKQLITDFTKFDWEKAKTQFVKSCEPKMRMLTFGITRALARFANDPTLFYLQALSLRPTDKPLWYEFGCATARLQNFKTSEMAFKQCLSPYSDAGIKLAIVYFYSKDYHKCLPLLREMLTSRPSCLALWILKTEISKMNKFWKFFVELYFPSNSLFFQEPTIPSDVYEKVLKEIKNFTTTQPPPEKFRSDYSIESLLSEPIRLNIEQTMENFTEFICKYFDQSLKQQLPFQQTVHFAKEKRHHSNRLNHSSMNESLKSQTPLPDTDSQTSLLNDEVEAASSSAINDMVNILEDVEFVVQKLVNNVVQGKIPKPIKPKRRPPRKNPNLSLDVRRSGRTSKEIPFEAMDSPVIGTFQQPTNSEPVTIRTFLDLPSDETTFAPLEFPGAQGFPFDDLTYNIIPSFSLETFSVYLTTLLNRQHVPMEELLHTFLCFFSWNLPSGCQLTVEQRKLFLEIYIRWTETFCQPFEQHCINASIKDISIHLLALELDDIEKLKASEACEIIFNRYSGILQKQHETITKFNVTQKGDDGNAVTDKAMRMKAIQLLTEVDPEMAAKIKVCMEDSRISTKALSKDINVEETLGTFAFTKDDYFAGGLKSYRPKAKKQASSVMESQEKLSTIEICDDKEFDLATLRTLNLCEPSTSVLSETTTKMSSEFNAKFIPLWADLSKIMQRISKDTVKELNNIVTEREMSPMDEQDMLSMLNGISADDDESENDIFQSFKNLNKTAPNHSQIEGLLKEYIILLEKFVQEFKYKKEIEMDEIKTFLNDTKKAIQAIKSVLGHNLMEEEDFEMDEIENDKLKELAVRFYWFKVAKLKDSENVELKKAYLSTILHLMDLDKPIYTQLQVKDEKYTVVTAKEVIKMLMYEFRREKIKNISKLIAAKKHQEVILQFTTDFNWYSCDEKEIISNIQILLSSFEAVKDRKGPVQWICRLLDRVISGKFFETFRDNIYLSCLQQLEKLNLEEVEHEVLKLLVKRLVVLSEYDRFKKNVRLWKILYRVATILEGKYDENSRIEMYQTIEAYKSLMPTKALCLLAEGHRILGEEHHCCTINNGELLYFFIDELYKNYYNFRFEDNYYSKLVQRNIELQLIQCLKCLFDSSIGKSVVYDHECSISLIPTIAVAKKVQPFLIPNLPMFDDEKFTTNDVIDALTRVFPFIENEKISGFDQAWTNFEIFIKNPPFFKFQEIKKSDIQPIGDFKNANLWPSVEINDENREKLELFVYLRYVLLVIKYKKQSYTWEENEKLAQLAKECLVLSGPPERKLLPLKIIHSLWAICAYTHTMYFCSLEDEELAKEANSYFYMFKMAFLQYPEAFQLHIDIAIAYYQINTRIRRHITSLPDKKLPEEIEKKISQEDMIKQCQLHFNQFRYRISQTNEYPKDISWIEPYFSGKIAEHNERPASEIFEHYYRCAMLMRAEAYTYPLRVNKTTQENVEPLELHYRVHVYAMKQIFGLENVKPFEKRVEHLKIIRYYLRLFLGHFIFAKKNPPPLPTIETSLAFVDSTPPWDFEEQPEIEDEGEEYNDDPIQDTVELMLNYTDLKIECLEYCRRGFSTIVKRFPHYKSYYQLAALHFIDGEYKEALEIIFVKLFRGKFVKFENVIDIERTDIERSNTLTYHIKKLIRLTIALLKKCRDISKTNSVLEDLVRESSTERLKLKPLERKNFILLCLEIYSDACVKVTRNRNIDEINGLIKLLEKTSSILRNHKKPEFDEKVKHCISRCRNTVRNILEAREKERNNELATSRLQEIMKFQQRIADKQKQDYEEKIKQVAEEQRRKQREEEEKKKRAATAAAAVSEAAAEKRRKEVAQTQSSNNILAYQKILESKKAEEAKKAKRAEILRLVTEKLNRIVDNPYILPAVKKHLDERRPALMDALKESVAKGETLVTLINQLDKFDKSLEKSNLSLTATTKTSIPPSRSVQQVQRNGSHASNSTQMKQQISSQQPINLSSKHTTSSSTTTVSQAGVKEKAPPSAAATALNRNIQMPQQSTTPTLLPQSSRTAPSLHSPSVSTPQKPSQSSSSTSASSKTATPSKATTPSKTAAVDDQKSREQVINDIGKLLQQYASPGEMKEFERLKNSMLQKTTKELQQVYSTMFVRYICGKTSATNVTSTSGSSGSSSNSGKRTSQQISPSNQSNIIASKIRRTDNPATTTMATAPSSSKTNSPRPQTSQTNIQQRNITTFQTPALSQNTPQKQSSSSTISKTSQSKLPQTPQQQQQQRFDHWTEQVKKFIPTTVPATATSNKSTSDDEIMIIGETRKSSSSSKNVHASNVPSSSTPSTPKSSIVNPTSKEATYSDRQFAAFLTAVNKTQQASTSSSSSRLPQNLGLNSRSPQTLSSQNLSTSKSKTQQQNITSNSNLPSSTSTSATTLPNLTPAALANYNSLVQHQMQNLLQSVPPQNQEQMVRAFIASLNPQNSTNQKR